MNNKALCLRLIKSETENEVVEILESAGLWDNSELWQDYGENDNNFSTIGNQQSGPDIALVEKIVNSVDAVLMREAYRKGIDVEGEKAPRTISDALNQFFGIAHGKLSNISASERADIAKNIMVVTTGGKQDPSFAIIDQGEGQTPEKVPLTLLSINKSNKLKIPFVQGKFNMGGTGALQFCSKKRNLQLIVTKRDPMLVVDDSKKNIWSFTVIRREDPTDNRRSSTFKYLAPDKSVITFEALSLPILPGEYPNAYSEDLSYGTYIKLYEYQIGPALRTNIKLDLYYRLSLLMPGLALPVTLYERRPEYRGHSHHIVMSGLSVRLDEDKRENLEEGFPSSAEISIRGEHMDIQIYAFKPGQRNKYAKNEGVIFTVNGQGHGNLGTYFFERKAVGMQALSDSIMVLVDCSKLSGRTREDLFMNSRDRLRDGDLKDEIESQLTDIIRNHQGLRDLREKRRREEIESKLQDSKPLTQVIEKVIKSSPTLSRLFLQGNVIRNPFDLRKVKSSVNPFNGKRYPTYFRLKKKISNDNPHACPVNKKFRIQFETDAENDYFKREDEAGDFQLSLDGGLIENYSLNLWNGLATLTVELPDNKGRGYVTAI